MAALEVSKSGAIISPTFEDYGLTVANVLDPTILLAFCHGIHTSIFFVALYYISWCPF
ncbi:hypothetical protein BDZ89DRAFT_593162 [Hymenopellis radicata]|nr:hypothetical protein BDZ89DRAFT_593162 [Hymenopellis radicata]